MSGLEALGLAANLIAVIDVSARIISWCYKYSNEVKNAKSDIDRLQRETANYKTVAEGVQNLIDGPGGENLKTSKKLLDAAVQGRSLLQELEETLGKKKGLRRLGFRALKWPFESEDIEKHIRNLERSAESFNQALQVDQTVQILQIDEKAKLDRFPVAEGASSPSDEDDITICLPGTRVQLQKDIKEWANKEQGSPVMWLSGMPGTGKSTLSLTLARSFESDGVLGAAFFFKRTQKDRSNLSKFVSTLAADLAIRVPSTRSHILKAVEDTPGIFKRTLGDQLDQLLLEPLANCQRSHKSQNKVKQVFIVIDALDECDNDEDIKSLIRLLTQPKVAQLSYLKIFLTSRPELPIRLGFNIADPKAFRVITLHDVPEHTIEKDILIFLEHHLAKVREEYNATGVPQDETLGSDWPGPEKTTSLLKMSIPLFIFAATVCRFIGDRIYGHPDSQLQEILEDKSHQESYPQLHKTYLTVLNRIIAGRPKKQCEVLLGRFQSIVGSIILLARPLSKRSVSQILGIGEHSINSLLDGLHSVISIPDEPTSTLKLFHLSFRDFLLVEDEENPFMVNPKNAHANLARRCLVLLDGSLQENVCGMNGWGTARNSIEATKIHECLPPEAQYACIYWVHHFQQAGTQLEDDGQAHKFLKSRLLHWLEAMSVLDKAYECVIHLRALRTLADPIHGQELSRLLDDADLFIRANIATIDTAPLQLYSSILAFTPTKSKVRATYEDTMNNHVTVQTRAETSWGNCIQVHQATHKSDALQQVSFSPDSSLVALASKENLQIWDVNTGECLRKIEKDFGDWPFSPVFSNDKSFIFSTSMANGECHLEIWNINTGEGLLDGNDWDSAKLESFPFLPLILWEAEEGSDDSHSDQIHSDDDENNHRNDDDESNDDRGSSLYRKFMETRMVLWRADTDQFIGEFKGQITSEPVVAISRDLKLIAAAGGSAARTKIQVWDAISCTQTSSWVVPSLVRSLDFSHDGTLLAVGSSIHLDSNLGDGEVATFLVNTGERICSFDVDDEMVYSVAFSHDSTILAWGTTKGIIYLSCPITGKRMQIYKGHTSFIAGLAFSQDSTLLVSASGHGVVRIWRVTASVKNTIISSNETTDPVKGVTRCFSPDLKWALSQSHSAYWLTSATSNKCLWSWQVDNNTECYFDFSPNSSFLLVYYYTEMENKSDYILHTETGERFLILEHQDKVYQAYQFSPDSTFVGTISNDKYGKDTTDSMFIWNFNTGECVCIENPEYNQGGKSFAFSPDSQLVAWAQTNTITFWSTKTGNLEHRLEFPEFNLNEGQFISRKSRKSFAISPESKLVAVAVIVRSRAIHKIGLQIWRYDTGQQVHDLDFSCEVIPELRFIHNYNLLLVKRGPEILIWEVLSGVLVATVPWCGYSESLRFSDKDWRLINNLGAFNVLRNSPLESPYDTFPLSPTGFGISIDRCWIMWNETKVLYLPPDYRPDSFFFNTAVCDSRIIIRSDSGAFVFFYFSSRSPGDEISAEIHIIDPAK